MSERLGYDVLVIGGGPAGTTTALYTTRLGHSTAVFEREGGRHAAVTQVHNLYGVSEAVSGSELARHAADQLQEYGGDYHVDPVRGVREDDDAERRFVVESSHATVEADRVVFATGFSDVEPSVPELQRFSGRGLHYCLHCDAYTLGDSSVFVLGHGEHAAEVAMLLLNFTDDVDLLLDGEEPTWDEETERQLAAHPVERIDRAVDGAFARAGTGAGSAEGPSSGGTRQDDNEGPAAGPGGRRSDEPEAPWLGGLRFVDGTERQYRGGFAMYGKEYNAELAENLGCELTDDGAIDVGDDHETSVDGAYAVGDVTHGQNQTTIALADGARAGVAIHKDLRAFPRSPEALDEEGEVEADDVPAAPPDLRARMRLLRTRSTRAGLQDPPPRQ